MAGIAPKPEAGDPKGELLLSADSSHSHHIEPALVKPPFD